MSKSVSNDALWEKLSEIEEKINKSLKEQKVPIQAKEQRNLTPEIKATKDEIIEKLEKYIQGLGTHCDNRPQLIDLYPHSVQYEATKRLFASDERALQARDRSKRNAIENRKQEIISPYIKKFDLMKYDISKSKI